MFHGVPHEVFPHGQNQCPEGENFKLLANFNGIHPRGVGEDAAYINNEFQQGNNNGWNNQSRPQGSNSNFNSNFNSNQPSLKDLELGQAKINKKSK